MNIVKAYYILNMKMLIKDKLSFIWAIFLPSTLFIFNTKEFYDVIDMRFYWAYIIFSAYVFGVGLHSLNLKEQGTLKTYFSIRESRVELFVANILTQITFSFISIFFFNLFSYLTIKTDIWLMLIYSIILIFAAIPVAFLFFSVTLIKNVHYNSLNTLMMILTIICMFVIQTDSYLNYINPLNYISNILMINSIGMMGIYVITSIIFILIGMYSIKRFSIISNEVR